MSRVIERGRRALGATIAGHALRWGIAILTLGVVLTTSSTTRAHPAGFTSVNRYVGVSCGSHGNIHLAYLLDFAELPAYAEIEQLDADHDGSVTPAEQRAYLDRRLPPLVARWSVDVNGTPAALRVTGSSLEALPGERGLSTLRIAADIEADVSLASIDAGDVRVHVIDPVFADRSGWRQMAAESSNDAIVIEGSKVGSEGALAYGSLGAEGPPRVDDAVFTFRARGPAHADADRRAGREPLTGSGPPVAVDPRLARLSSMMRDAQATASFSALALALAFALGAAHALSPGHGKALAATYLVGNRARPRDAVLFGIAVTVAHTAVVFALGGLALTIERTIGSDRVLRGLEEASAVLVVVLGVVQLSRRWREALGQDGGHHHHAATRDRAGISIDDDPAAATRDGADRLADCETRSRSARGLRSLVALGMSSGLTPCPSALALLLAAVALHRYVFGLVVVIAFSAGVAVTLTAAGLLVLMARKALDRIAVAAPLLRWLPVASSTGVLVLGILLCVSAWSPGGSLAR